VEGEKKKQKRKKCWKKEKSTNTLVEGTRRDCLTGAGEASRKEKMSKRKSGCAAHGGGWKYIVSFHLDWEGSQTKISKGIIAFGGKNLTSTERGPGE